MSFNISLTLDIRRVLLLRFNKCLLQVTDLNIIENIHSVINDMRLLSHHSG